MIKGLVTITGKPGIGKTTAALEAGNNPEDIAYMGMDSKPTPIDGLYFDKQYLRMLAPGHEKGALEVGMVEEFIEDLNSMLEARKGKKLGSIVCDGWENMRGGLNGYVDKHYKSLKASWSGSGEWLVRQKLSYGKKLEAALLDSMLEVADTVFIIVHLTPGWAKKVKIDDMLVPDDRHGVLKKHSRLQLWLKANPTGHKMPVALVVKDLPKSKFIEGVGIRTVPTLPPKLSQECLKGWKEMEQISIWDVINHYLENPVGNQRMLNLEPYEMLTPDEEHLIRGTLTDDQLDQIEFAKELALVSGNEELTNRVRELAQSGLPGPVIFSQLKEEFEDITLPQIMKIREAVVKE